VGRVFVITGSGKGIGQKMALHYLAQGNAVAGCSRSEPSIVDANYTHFQLDVADEKAVVAMVQTVRKSHGGIDVLLNNAGIAAMNHLATTPMQTVQKIFATNVFGSFIFLREVAKVMMRATTGRIVNFSTVAVPLRLEGESIYGASKAAIEHLTRVAARELGSSGITVNAVGPAPVDTDLVRSVPAEKIDALVARQAVRRLGTFADVIHVVDFFIDPRSSFVTGQVLYLGGAG
jgi:3-oxoacyl-[acyl-carrier protein] reductase